MQNRPPMALRYAATTLAMAIPIVQGGAALAADMNNVCALPVNALFLSPALTESSSLSLRPCVSANGDVGVQCISACSCRELLTVNAVVYAVCMGDAASCTGDAQLRCPNALTAASTTKTSMRRVLQISTNTDTTVPIALDASSTGSADKDALKPWMWAVIAIAIALLIGLMIFIWNWYKNRPKLGDNRVLINQATERRASRKDLDSVEADDVRDERKTRRNVSNTSRTSRTREANPSLISGASGGSYHNYGPGTADPRVITDTDMEVNPTAERAFSPISSDEYSSSTYSEGYYLRQGLESMGQSSEFDLDASFSSQISVEDESEVEVPRNIVGSFPRKKSIEF